MSGEQMSEPTDVFEVYAMRYAHRESGVRGEHFYGFDPCQDQLSPMDYYVWAAISPSTTVIVDAGFTPQTAAARGGGREYLRTPMDTLADLGRSADSVEHLVITHLHYDHVGHIPDFPHAEVLVQRAEYDFWSGPMADRGDYAHLSQKSDMDYLAGRLDGGRVRLLDGDFTVVPGVTTHFLGGHTPGIQAVRVKTEAGYVALASDSSHFYENFQTDRPFAIVDHLPSMYLAFDRLRELASSEELIIPGHDPRVLERFPAVSPELEGFAVRIA